MPLYTGVGVLVVLRCCRLNVAEGICLTWVSCSFLKAKVHMWFLFCYSSILWSARLTKLSVLHVSVFFVSLTVLTRVCMHVCACEFDFHPHVRLQKKRTTAWHGHRVGPYPTHQPVCEQVQQPNRQALTETSITLLLLMKLTYTLAVPEST